MNQAVAVAAVLLVVGLWAGLMYAMGAEAVRLARLGYPRIGKRQRPLTFEDILKARQYLQQVMPPPADSPPGQSSPEPDAPTHQPPQRSPDPR